MDLFDLLLTRRSIRQYTGQPVSQEDLRAVLAAELYVKYAEAQNSAAARYIESSTLADLDLISAVKEEEL